ncbi:hypothetical protein ACVXG7_18200 [Enterobacter hormaechei]
MKIEVKGSRAGNYREDIVLAIIGKPATKAATGTWWSSAEKQSAI